MKAMESGHQVWSTVFRIEYISPQHGTPNLMSAFHRLFYNGRHIHASAPVTSQNDYRQGCGGCYPFKIVDVGDLEPNISAIISKRCRECHQWNQLVCFMDDLVAILHPPDR